ncbi:MAG: hypothetical protein KF847_10225 [Pirellulales bacterium]|nr:hypothetical protein [Pirellulales bacterium]
MSEATSNSAPSAMTPEQVQTAEAKLGRQLSDVEKRAGAMMRPDDRDTRQKIADSNWKVTPKKPEGPTTRYDAALSQAEEEAAKEADAKAVREMSPAERRLRDVKQWRQQELDRIAAADKAKARLEEPGPIKTALDTLDALRADAAFNPLVRHSEMLAMDRAERQIKEGDEAVGFKMLEDIIGRA